MPSFRPLSAPYLRCVQSVVLNTGVRNFAEYAGRLLVSLLPSFLATPSPFMSTPVGASLSGSPRELQKTPQSNP